MTLFLIWDRTWQNRAMTTNIVKQSIVKNKRLLLKDVDYPRSRLMWQEKTYLAILNMGEQEKTGEEKFVVSTPKEK